MITSSCGWCLLKCYLLLTCCSNLDSSKRNGRSIDELICSDRDWKQTDWTQLLPFHWYSQELICIRKTKFHNQSLNIYIDCGHELKTQCVLIKHSIMRHIIKMNKHSKYVLGFREISMAETGFHNKLSPSEISRIRKIRADISDYYI